MTTVPPDATGAKSWRYACPHGHVALVHNLDDSYYCESCQCRYEGDPIDLKRGVPT